MSRQRENREFEAALPTTSDCKLFPLAEALARGDRAPIDCLGVVACGRCLGVFDVHSDPGTRTTIENPGHVSCHLGYSNNPEAHLEE